jgi:hypothetical protein
MTAIATVTESTALLEAASTNNYHNDCSDHQHHGENGEQKGLSEEPQSGSCTHAAYALRMTISTEYSKNGFAFVDVYSLLYSLHFRLLTLLHYDGFFLQPSRLGC